MVLRKVKNNWESCKEQALELQSLVQEKFDEDKLFEGFCKSIVGEEIDIDSWLEELESDMVTSD